MTCPYCGKEMIVGKAENASMHSVMLIFKKNDEEIRMRDILKKRPSGFIIGDTDAFYCDECNKMAVMTDC